MKENIESALGCGIEVIFEDVPSKILPFVGNFPLVEPYRKNDAIKLFRENGLFDDLPEWLKPKVRTANFIGNLQKNFIGYLLSKNINPRGFSSEVDETKLEVIREWMDKNCISDSYFVIK